jgi:hypothetical protein
MSIQWLDRETLIQTVPSHIQPANFVLEFGCGIRPQQFIAPRLYVCCEPHDEYLAVLKDRFMGTNTVVIQGIAQDIVRWMPDTSVDSIFMIDLIEHIEKSEGLHLISECERIARQQIVIFTTLGFLRQDYKPGEADGWNLCGGKWQDHKSGWTPDDFDESWEILGARDYHITNAKGEELHPPRGAFWAFKTLQSFPTAEAIAVSWADRMPEDSGIDTTQALIKLLSDIERLVQDLVEPNKMEMALQLCQREAELAVRAAELSRREARYDSLLLVRLVRKLRRTFKASR